MKKKKDRSSFVTTSYIWIKQKHLSYIKTRNVKEYIENIGGGYAGTEEEYRKNVLSYWKKYGKRPKRYWYTLYCNGKESYDPRFVPDSMWYEDILPYYNNLMLRWAYADKGMYSRLFRDIRKPETIVKNIAGYFYNGDGELPISREEAERLCEKEEQLIIKPSMNSGGGSGIVFYDRGNKNSLSIRDIFDSFKIGFVVQRIVKQHPDLARINKDSLNTIRVMSFRFKGEVHILSAQLRMGGPGARVDNYNAGGCACSIKSNGWLEEKAVTRESGWSDHHTSGIKFKDIQVPNYEGIIESVKKLHVQLPYFNIIGWDFAVAEDGEPVFMEFNVTPTQNQVGGGEPTFGDLSDEVFEDVFITKTLADVHKKTLP